MIANISFLYLSISSYNKYNRYNEIIYKKEFISNFKIINVYCHTRTSSNLDIYYNNKSYNVSVSGLGYYSCEKLKYGLLKIKFYYDKENDKIFTIYSTNKKIVIFIFITFFITLGFWFLPQKYW